MQVFHKTYDFESWIESDWFKEYLELARRDYHFW